MISTHIIGGLGNQMFQYCAGRALALRHGVALGLDTRAFNTYRAFSLGLSHFDIQAQPQAHLEPARKNDGTLRYLLSKLRPDHRIYKEASLAYDPVFETLGDGTYLTGYWQSARYFEPYSAQIRKDLTIVTPPSAENQAILDQIGNGLAVSLHIRRGDYVTNAKFNATHGTCDLPYYARAAAHIADQTGSDPLIYVFSDDPDWVSENLTLPFEVRLMRHNDSDHNYEDLRLMAACQHHIIANSSFSWWGAWLNPSPDKIVMSPTRWFADPTKHNPDILPKSWQTISNVS